MTRVVLRFDFDGDARLGPGKVALLERIRERGSIAAAGRSMGMSYRRAWLLVDSLNRCFREPVVATQLGGRGGGAAALTPFGEQVIARYHAMQAAAEAAVARDLAALEAALASRSGAGARERG
jgi:molybdate transport system regulatory protein